MMPVIEPISAKRVRTWLDTLPRETRERLFRCCTIAELGPTALRVRWRSVGPRSNRGLTPTSGSPRVGDIRSAFGAGKSWPQRGVVSAWALLRLNPGGGSLPADHGKKGGPDMLTFFRDDEGQGLVEYALIIAVIAIAVIVAMIFLRGQLQNIFSNIGNNLT